MGKFFDLDNPIWRFVGKLADALFLNLMWFVFSIPIVTIGASTTALYYVSMKLVRDTEGTSLFRDFMKSFKLNFKQSTIIWLICLLLMAFFGLDIYYYWNLGNQFGSAVTMAFIVLSALLFMTMLYIFPVQSRYDNPVKKTFLFSVLLPLRHIIYTIPMILVWAAMIVGTYFYLPLIIFGHGLVAFLNSYFLVKVFDRYTPEEEVAKEEEDEPVHVILDEHHSEHVIIDQTNRTDTADTVTDSDSGVGDNSEG